MDKNKLTIICICLYIGLSINNTQALGSRPSNVGWYNSDTSYNLIAVFRVTIGLDPRSAPPKAQQNQHMQDPEFRIRPSNDAKAQQTQQEQHEPETTTSDDAKAQQTVISDTIKEQQIQQEQQAIPRDAALDRSIVRLAPAETDESRQTALENEKLMACSRGHVAVLLPSGKVLAIKNGRAYVRDPEIKTWKFIEDFDTESNNLAAILLHDGKVLVMVGETKSCKIYDPATGSLTPTGSLNTIRSFSDSLSYRTTATRLSDGKVLVVGGTAKQSDSCEIYDPKTGTWEPTGSLNIRRYDTQYLTTTLLPDERILMVAGDKCVCYNKCEVYDPVVKTWKFTGENIPIEGGWHLIYKAVLLPNSKVLVFAENNDFRYAIKNSCSIYDLKTEKWTLTKGLILPRERNSAAITPLPCGKVLVAGGKGQDGIILKSCEIYDSATDSWTSAGNLSFPRAGHTATLLPDGQVLIIGGIMCATQGSFVSCEIYSPEKPELQSRLERGQQDYQKNAQCIIQRQKIEHLRQFLCQMINGVSKAMEVKK